MSDTDTYKGVKSKWDFSKNEKAFIDHCIKVGYEIADCKQYVSKTKWKIKVNGIQIDFETSNTGKFNGEFLERVVSGKLEIEALKKQLAEATRK